MAKKITNHPNANLPPLMVLTSFLNEKKREFVTNKLKEFGLVRQEFFDRKAGHKKKDFPFKRFLGKRYRFVTAPMTDQEVDQLFLLVQTLISITPKASSQANLLETKQGLGQGAQPITKKPSRKFSLLALLLNLFALITLAIGGYSAYEQTLLILADNLAIIPLILAIGELVITLIVPSFILFALAKILKQ
jgi:hypothetical protein